MAFPFSRMNITLAIEDAVSEAVANRLVSDYLPGAAVSESMGNQGIGFIRRRMRDLNQIALYQNPVLVLADLDRPQDCAANRVMQLRGRLAISSNLLIRIAVLEIESWLLSDREGIAKWMNVPANAVPRSVETLQDPKRELRQLAERCRDRRLREGIAPRDVRGTHRTGQGYNDLLGEFATQHWNPEAARLNAPSLDRAIVRIAELADL